MNWWEALHVAVSIALFVLIFIEGDDEPFGLRTFTAALIGRLWFPLLIVLTIFIITDWIGDRLKAFRK